MVVGIDKGWSEGFKAAFLRTNTGLFLVLGGFKAGSHKYRYCHGSAGSQGRQAWSCLGSYGMITWRRTTPELGKPIQCGGRTVAARGLLNPTNYVERMVGDKVSLLQTRERLEALKTLGFFAGDVARPGTLGTEP